jgi:voltage-gated potassium channel
VLTWIVRLFNRRQGKHVAALLAGVAAVIVAGGTAFAVTQHAPVTTGLYWAVTTASTVGYGDVTPKNPSGRLIVALVMLTAIPMLGAAFALMTGVLTVSRLRRLLHLEGAHMPQDGFRIVAGSHPSVPRLLPELVDGGERVVLVAPDAPPGTDPRVHVVKGSPTDPTALASAEPERAVHALIAEEDDGDVLVTALMLRRIAPALPLVALVRSEPVMAGPWRTRRQAGSFRRKAHRSSPRQEPRSAARGRSPSRPDRLREAPPRREGGCPR